MKRRVGFVIGILTVTGLTVGAFYVRRGEVAPGVVTAEVTRGPIVSAISASGTLEAVTTVQVGTQVSGTIESLYADFNSIVKKGQVIARLDPSLFQTQVDSARANLVSAEANLQRFQVALDDSRTKARRASELAAKQLIPASDLETAEVAGRSAEAQVRAAEAQLKQARAALTQAEVNLQKTVITAPINGIVIGRNVDVGQTVAASLQAPTLFTLAADLSQMQVKASIDESDLGSVKEGQAVAFRVDAYPNRTFEGTIKQVRLNPVVEQNVVTYAAIISASNPALELKPGMTANVSIEVARRDDVLRVPSAALRFRPTAETLAALGQDTAVVQQQPAGAGGRSTTARQAASGTVWLFDGRLHPAQVRTGVTDGVYTEIVGGSIQEGTVLATRVDAAPANQSAGAAASSPLLPQNQRRRF
jgi:HlyD family secretion protein